MSYLKCINSLKAITTNVRRILLFVPNKSLCSKKVKDFNVTIKIGDDKVEKKKSQSLFNDEDDETETVVITEREKEASVKSRLSKECNKIYGKDSQSQNVPGLKIQKLFETDAENSQKVLEEAVVRMTAEPPKTKPAAKPLKSIAERKSKAIADTKSKAIAESKSKAPAESKSRAPTESKSKATAEPKSKATVESKSKATAEPKSKISAKPTSQLTSHSDIHRKVVALLDTAHKIVKGDGKPPTHPPPRTGTIKRREAGEVIYAFIPREWFTAFIPKTGVTGFGTFLVTTGTFLISKEYYVLEHNFYGGISMAILIAGAIRYVGPHLAAFLDKGIKEYEEELNRGKIESVLELESHLLVEIREQYETDGALMLVEAKRENVKLQLENEFRKRQMRAYNEVVHILNYHVATFDIREKIQQRNLVDYVTKHVLASITPEIHKKLMNVSMDSLIKELTRHKEMRKHKEEEQHGEKDECEKKSKKK